MSGSTLIEDILCYGNFLLQSESCNHRRPHETMSGWDFRWNLDFFFLVKTLLLQLIFILDGLNKHYIFIGRYTSNISMLKGFKSSLKTKKAQAQLESACNSTCYQQMV